MAEILEAAMVISFGISWPMSIIKSYRSRTNQGKSIIFILLIMLGYICGIFSKIFANAITYVFAFYVINLVMVGIDCALYLRNVRFDQKRKATT
jgi:hypothetical protein